MKLRSWSLLVIVALASTPVAHADKEKAKDHFRKGMARYTLEKWDEAIAEFEEGYTEEPDPSFLYNIAQAHRLANRPKQALDFYRKFLNRKPDAPNRAEIEDQIAALQKTVAQGGDPIPPGAAKPKAGAVQPKPEVAQPKPEVAQPKPEVAQPKPEVAQPKPVVVAPKPEPVQPKPVVVAPKPEPVQPKPVVVQPKPAPVVVAVAPPPKPVVAPVPVGARDLGAPPPTVEKKRWPMWVGIAAGAVVVAGGAAAAGILLSKPGTLVLPAEQVP